ncbi:MAG: hypothetical protein QW478_14135 [Candidatus Micrarchaeaceae archaeon]
MANGNYVSASIPVPDWKMLKGKPYVTVSAKGISNGLSNIPNDGADFGPDTPGTQTYGIQEAFNFVANSGKPSIVKLLSGIFYPTSAINYSGTVPLRLTGNGAGNIYQLTGETIIDFSQVNPSSLLPNTDGVGGAAITFNHPAITSSIMPHLEIDHIQFQNMTISGASLMSGARVNNLYFHDNFEYNLTTGITIQAGFNVFNAIHIAERNTAYQVGYNPFSLWYATSECIRNNLIMTSVAIDDAISANIAADTPGIFVEVSGNYIYNTTPVGSATNGRGIVVSPLNFVSGIVYNAVIENNLIVGPYLVGIDIFPAVAHNTIRIAGNYISGMSANDDGTLYPYFGSGIRILLENETPFISPKLIEITGNTITGNDRAGIYVGLSGNTGCDIQNLIINDNTIYNNNQQKTGVGSGIPAAGLSIIGSAAGNNTIHIMKVTGNRFFDNQTTPTQLYAIQFDNNGNTTTETIETAIIDGNSLDNTNPFYFGSNMVLGSASRIINNKGYNPQGFNITTPAFPASGTAVQNTNPYPVRIYLLTLGGATAVSITDIYGNTKSLAAPSAGNEYTLDPGASITFTWSSTSPTWLWYGV